MLRHDLDNLWNKTHLPLLYRILIVSIFSFLAQMQIHRRVDYSLDLKMLIRTLLSYEAFDFLSFYYCSTPNLQRN